MKLVSKLLLIFFMLGLVSVCLPQKVLAVSDEGITSFQLYQSKANQGDADSQYNLALLYYHGLGVPHDAKQAVYWYTKAAEQGHVQAQYELGSLYHAGYGEEVTQDYKQAVYWLTKAAEKGSVHAQYSLGRNYQYGDGAPQDYKQAFFWYTKAAEKGYYFAKVDRDKMLEKMSQSQKKVLAVSNEGISHFRSILPKAQQGDANAQYNLALLYENGVGIYRDGRKAVYWYTKASQQGHVEAQYRLGTVYRFGYGEEVVQTDFKKAVYWITKASEQGHIEAQYNLGHIYEYGDEAPQDYKQAFFWYTKAAEKSHYFAKEDRDKMLEKMSQSQIEEAQKLSKELYEKINNKAK